MNVLQELARIDRFAAKAHILKHLDMTGGDRKRASFMLHVTPQSLDTVIADLQMVGEVKNLIKKRKYPSK